MDKSWVEICEEELAEEAKSREGKSRTARNLDFSSDSTTATENETENIAQTIERNIMKNVEESIVQSIDRSIAETIGRSGACSSDDNLYEEVFAKPSVHVERRRETNELDKKIVNILSYAEALRNKEEVTKDDEDTNSTIDEAQSSDEGSRTLPQEDISLSGHLDVFHVASPRKQLQVAPIPLDEETIAYGPDMMLTPRNTKRPFAELESPRRPDAGSSTPNLRKVAKGEEHADVHAKDVDSPGGKREVERDPDVLSRRQKQIDYGKNTIGYERYSKMVPRHKRSKEHPKTPPKNLKMSRRTWDGLVKNWRLRLHNWDPLTEEDEYDFDNYDPYALSSDQSSYDSSSVCSESTPSTPKTPRVGSAHTSRTDDVNESGADESLWTRRKKEPKDDEYLECEPLPEYNY